MTKMRPPKTKNKIRADLALLERGFAKDAKSALSLLLSGVVLEGDQRVTQAGAKVDVTRLRLQEEPKKFVGRGGDKLEGFISQFSGALEAFKGNWCLDVGASTGGFTDCLLKHGAKSVVAVDVGFNQLDWSLRTDPRVVCLERTDARQLTWTYLDSLDKSLWKSLEWAELREKRFSMIVADVSFISLKLILPSLKALMAPQAWAIVLFKPQFELSADQVGSGGIVSNEGVIQTALEGFRDWCGAEGWVVKGLSPSVLKGHDGNQEYFFALKAVESL